jgi:putative membrane protein
MQFLKILFWCLLTFLAALFTYGNWTTVPLRLWGGLIAEVNLPLLLLATVLLGFVPTWLYYIAVRWRLRQRLASAQRAVEDLQRMPVTPPVQPPAMVSEATIPPEPA